MKRFSVAVKDDLYEAVLAAVEDADKDENVSRFIRDAIRAELARRNEERGG